MSERKVDQYCNYCGKEIPENIINCPHCGKPKTTTARRETRYRSPPFGRSVLKRGLMEKDLMIIIFLIFGLTISVAIIVIFLVISIPK